MSTKEVTIQKAMEVAADNGGTIISNENIVYLMGTCFVLGSLFTIFILIILDFMRLQREKAEK